MVFVVVGGKPGHHNCFIYRHHKQNIMAEKETVRYTILPGMTSPIVLKTMPDAVCRLQKEGGLDLGLTLYADPDGLIRFHVLPTSEEPMKMIADCQAGDKSEGYPVELHPGQPTDDKPAQIYEPKLRTEDFVRPALSEQEMLRLSDAELSRRGHPVRPAGLHPVIFNNWRKQVSKPVTVSHLISHGALKPAMVNPMRIPYTTGTTSPNWCGYLLTDDKEPNNGYCLVHAEFYVPTALGGPEDTTLATSFWVGYGGYGSTTAPFVAAGIEISDIKYTTGGETLGASAWIQNSSARDSGAERITNFQVDPGNDIVLEVYIWGAEREPDPWHGQPDQEGTNMGYNIYNTTKGTGVTGSWLVGRPIKGTQVEWMVSKEPGSYDNLGICNIYPMVYARKCTRPGGAGYPPSYETYSYNSDNNIKFTMINATGNVIGTVAPDSISPQNLYYNISYSEPPGS